MKTTVKKGENDVKILSQHMKSGQFTPVYLIYGDEDYLRKQYKDRMKDALVGDDAMNYSYFEGKGISVKELIDLGETLPFFGERRLIIVENSGFFASSQDEMVAYLKEMPETTCFVFVEKDIDKRNKLFKAVSALGYAAHMGSPDERTLIRWIISLLRAEHRVMTEQTMRYFLERIDFIVRRNKALCQAFSLGELRKAVEICVERDEDVKTGRLNDRMAVELLIVRFSAKNK